MVDLSNASRASLTRFLTRCPSHFKPIVMAIRDEGCGFGLVLQNAGPFQLPLDRPTIVLVGDDFLTALGPNAFDAISLLRLFHRCEAIFVVAGVPTDTAYGMASSVAVIERKHVAIIETRVAHEVEWAEFSYEANRSAKVIVTRQATPTHPAGRP